MAVRAQRRGAFQAYLMNSGCIPAALCSHWGMVTWSLAVEACNCCGKTHTVALTRVKIRRRSSDGEKVLIIPIASLFRTASVAFAVKGGKGGKKVVP